MYIFPLSFTFCLEGFHLPLGAWDGLLYFIVALPGPSILAQRQTIVMECWSVMLK